MPSTSYSSNRAFGMRKSEINIEIVAVGVKMTAGCCQTISNHLWQLPTKVLSIQSATKVVLFILLIYEAAGVNGAILRRKSRALRQSLACSAVERSEILASIHDLNSASPANHHLRVSSLVLDSLKLWKFKHDFCFRTFVFLVMGFFSRSRQAPSGE
jgi:hypothetical protein